jgi:dihydropteroate synthase
MCVSFGSSYKYSKKMFHSVQHDNWIIFSIFAPYMNKNRQIDIMGIVNLTDDSYFSASRCASPSQAVALASRLVDEGASILDFGACSTRPGAEAVGAEEEWRRLRPALEAVRKEFPGVRISVDTYWSDVVRRAYDAIGDFVVNDISAGEDDPQMLPLVGRLGLTYVAMHKRGTPQTMQSMTDYEDVTAEVTDYFSDFAERAEQAGVRDWILDPGFGFAKTLEQNYQLMHDLSRFKALFPSRKLLVGVSRKSMVYRLLGITPEESLPATQVLHLHALQNGADILRVHDVAQAVQTVSLYRML